MLNFDDMDFGYKSTPSTYILLNKNVPIKQSALECDVGVGEKYFSGVPEDVDAFNQTIAKEGLMNLLKKYPYVQLKVNDDGMLEPTKQCPYDAVYTNAYHVFYHDILKKQQQQQDRIANGMIKPAKIVQAPNLIVQQPKPIQPPQTYGMDPSKFIQQPAIQQQQMQSQSNSIQDRMIEIADGVSVPLSRFVDLESDSKEELYGCGKLKEAFHMEPEPEPVYNVSLRQHDFVMNDVNNEFKYGIDNNKLPHYIGYANKIFPYHPNPEYNKTSVVTDIRDWPYPDTTPITDYPGGIFAKKYDRRVREGHDFYNKRSPVVDNSEGIPKSKKYTYPSGIAKIFNKNNGTPTTIPEDPNNVQIPTSLDMGTLPFFTTPSNSIIGNLNNVTNMAHSQANQAIMNNPSRLDTSRVVDFGNPESVAMIQNPFGYNNGYANPNIKNQDPMHYNPYQAMNNAWANNRTTNGWTGYNWYNSFNQFNDIDFMIPTKEDYKSGFAVKVAIRRNGKIVRKFYDDDDEADNKVSEKKESYLDLLHKPVKVHVRVVIDGKTFIDGKEVIPEEEKKENKSFEEKIVDNMQQVYDNLDQFEVPEETKLDMSDEDEKELDHLADEIAVYDKALAHAIYNAPVINGMTKETYKFWTTYIKNRLKEFKDLEKQFPERDFRLDYRYRKTPKYKITDNGKWIFDLVSPDYFPERKYNKKGKRVYDYDRGHEPTKKEWEIFYTRAFALLKQESNKLKMDWILQYNVDKLNKKGGDKETENKNSSMSPLEDWKLHRSKSENEYLKIKPTDTLWERSMKEHDQMVANQKFVYMAAVGHSMTPEQFNVFWNGPQARTEQVNPEILRKQDLARRTAQNIYMLSQAKPIDQVQLALAAFKEDEKRMREFDHDCMKDCKTLRDYFDNMGYLLRLCQEDNIKQQREKYKMETRNQYSYNKSLIDSGNSERLLSWNNTRPGMTFGTADPRYGFPSNYVDLTKTDNYNACKRRFDQYCNSMQTVPVEPPRR